MAQSISEELRVAAHGLLYPSESSAELEPFTWANAGELTPQRVRAVGGHAVDAKVEEMTLEDFFETPTTEEDWHGADEKASVAKFRVLHRLIKDRLKDIRVFRVGEVEITIHVVGRTPNGTLAGLTTQIVQT